MLKLYTENILNHVLQATPAQRRAGCAWYRLAGAFAIDLAKEYGTTRVVAAATIALLSPQKSWVENQRIANEALACHVKNVDVTTTNLHTGANLAKVQALFDAGQPTAYQVLGHLLGKNAPKVKAFFKNILLASKLHDSGLGMPSGTDRSLESSSDLRFEQAEAVTLDRHAIRVCDPTLPKTYTPTSTEHGEMCMAYVEAAIVLSRDFGQHYHPWQVQAIGWVVTRGGAA